MIFVIVSSEINVFQSIGVGGMVPAPRYASAFASNADTVVAFSRAIIDCHSLSARFFSQFRTDGISVHGV